MMVPAKSQLLVHFFCIVIWIDSRKALATPATASAEITILQSIIKNQEQLITLLNSRKLIMCLNIPEQERDVQNDHADDSQYENHQWANEKCVLVVGWISGHF